VTIAPPDARSSAATAAAAPQWETRWAGRWIWHVRPAAVSVPPPAAPPRGPDDFVFCRVDAELEQQPDVAWLRVTADSRYVLFVNGTEVARGPARSAPGTLRWDEVNIASLLRPGRNTVAAVVRHYGYPVPWWLPTAPYGELGRGGFICECPAVPRVSSGSHWECRRAPIESGPELAIGAANERYDARRVPAGWIAGPCGGPGWMQAVELHSADSSPRDGTLPAVPFTLVSPRTGLPPIGAVVRPREVHIGTVRPDALAGPQWFPMPDPAYLQGGAFTLGATAQLPLPLESGQVAVLDFAGMQLGTLGLRVDAASGAVIELRACDALGAQGMTDRDRQWHHRYTCRGSDDEVTPFEALGFRHLAVYARDPFTLRSVELTERTYPFLRDGRFECDDAELVGIWNAGARTLELCTTDAYLDCPSREQRAWLGDAYVHGLVNAVTSSDLRPAVNLLRLGATPRADGLLPMVAAGDLAGSPLTIPDYSLHWIRALRRYFEWSGDVDTVAELLPVSAGILDWFWQFVDRHGRLGAFPGWTFVDWTPVEGDRPLATLNALLLLTLDDVAWMAGATGAAAPRSVRDRARALRSGFEGFLHGPLGVSEWLDRPLSTQHAVATAVLAGLLRGPAADAALEAAMNPERVRHPVRHADAPRGWSYADGFDPALHVLGAQPFFTHFVHQALAAAGRRDLLLRSIRRWAPYLATGDGTVWEAWPDQGAELSHAHAWSATPTYDLSAHILGVTPAVPGGAVMSVRPWFGPLRRLSGAVPTPRGVVTVELAWSAAGPIGVVVLPDGVSGELACEEWPVSTPVALHPGSTQIG
jgi:alpha-L-rhamnosidase